MADENEALNQGVDSPSTPNTDTTDQNSGNDSRDSSSESLNGSGGSSGNTQEAVPYNRFKEKVDESNSYKAKAERAEALERELAEYKSWDTAHNLIKNQFGSPEKYNEALQASQRQAEEAEIAEQVRLEAESRNLDQETANQVYQTKLAKKDFDKTKAELDRILLEQKLTLAKNQFPEMDEDSVLGRAKKDGSDLIEIARKSHDKELAKIQAIEERAIARYNAGKEKQKETVPPEGSGGRMAQADRMPDPKIDPKGYQAWWRAKGAPVTY